MQENIIGSEAKQIGYHLGLAELRYGSKVEKHEKLKKVESDMFVRFEVNVKKRKISITSAKLSKDLNKNKAFVKRFSVEEFPTPFCFGCSFFMKGLKITTVKFKLQI